jgi:hypothetical protein
MAGDGATFLIHLQRIAMTKGAKGAVTDIELNYDPNNVAKDGYFTTTSPYPIYVKASDLATKKTLAVPINGIGESLSGKNVKAPQLNVIFNGDGTMTFGSVTGYDNDGNSAGATGANYDVVVDVIATFSTQPAVAQLPASINLFTGSASGDIALSGSSDYYENSMDGIEITLDDYIYSESGSNRISIDQLGIHKTFKISKKSLINGNSLNISNDYLILANPINYKIVGVNPDEKPVQLVTQERTNPSSSYHNSSTVIPEYPVENINSKISIGLNSINVDISKGIASYISGQWSGASPYNAKVIKVTPYKN